MTVKDRVGRTRYVAFHVKGGPLSRSAMGAVLPATAKLTRFDGAFGIVRTDHRSAAELVAKLGSVTAAGAKPVTIMTLVTSGTLRAAAKRLPPDAPAAARGSSFK